MTKYFLVNRNFGLIGGQDYESEEAAKAAIKNSNIPENDAEVFIFNGNYLNDCHIHPKKYLKC